MGRNDDSELAGFDPSLCRESCKVCGCFRVTSFAGGHLKLCPACNLMRPEHLFEPAPAPASASERGRRSEEESDG